MGLKCRIGRRADGTLLVTNENGTPSSLYQQALAYTKNEKDALEMWAVASTPDFVESIGKKGTVDDINLESVIQYYNSNKKLIGTLTPSETFEVKQMMTDHNVGSLSEMARRLKEIFYEGNIPNFYPEKAIKSGLFTSEDVKNIDLARIGDLIIRMEADALVNDFSVDTSITSSGYRNPSIRNIFGASEIVSMETVYQEVIAAVENPQLEQEIRQTVQDLPYTDLVTKFNEDETFAEQFISRFKNVRKILIVEERDSELVVDVTDTFSTIKNTISTDFDQLDIEAEILYIENIPTNIWEESKKDVAEIIKEIEADFADKNIDIVGLSEVTTDQATILRVLNAVNNIAKNPTNQNIQVFSDIYDEVFGKTSTKSVEKLPKELDGLTIVRMYSEKSDQQLFEQYGLIKVGDGLYHKIRTTDSLTDLYEAVYQQVKNGLVEIPERFNLTKDVNQKEDTLKDIEKFINSRKTGLDFYNERASLYQVIFGHPVVDNTRKISEDIKALAGVVTNVDYLKAGFISDFYNYILKEKLKNSAVYRNTLSKIKINDRDITIGNDISDLKNIEYYEELMDYLALKKDSTGKKYIAKEFKQEATNVLTAINFPQTIGEYNGVKNIVGNLMSIPRTVNNFVRVGDTLYQKVGENPQTSVFVKVKPNTNNLYYQTEVETENYTNEQVEKMKKQDMAALTQLTPDDIQQRKQKNGSLSKFVQTVKQKSIEYAKKVQTNFQASNQNTESKSNIKFEQNLIEFIKQKGINVIADSKVFTDKIKEMGFESINAMVQADTKSTRVQLNYGEDGKHLAPNGKPSNLSEQQAKIVRTDAFKKWFGDWENSPETSSRIVDENGEPRVMYTGTSKDKDFDKFNIPRNGAWFTSDPAIASMYAEENDSQKDKYNASTNTWVSLNTASRVIPVFLKATEIADFNKEVSPSAKEKLVYSSSYKKLQADTFQAIYYSRPIGTKRFDAIDYTGDGEVIVILEDANQIKSAIGNNGNFSTTNDKIQFLQTPQGDILGFEKNGSIYLDPTKLNNTTTLHELIHVFQSVLEAKASKGDKQAQTILQKRKDLFQDEATFWKEYHKFNVAPKGATQALILGEKGASSIDTIEEVTFRLKNLQVAKSMESDNQSKLDIRLATGWEKGADNLWRYEILDGRLKSDFIDKIKNLKEDNREGYDFEGTLEDVLDNEELFKSFPKLRGVKIEMLLNINNEGEYEPEGAYFPPGGSFPNGNIYIEADKGQILYTLLHEVQHAIQQEEGFAKGGGIYNNFEKLSKEDQQKAINSYNTSIDEKIKRFPNYSEQIEVKVDMETAKDSFFFNEWLYNALVGEVESRNVQERRFMNPEQRREILLEQTEDVSREDQIFLFQTMTTSPAGSVLSELGLDLSSPVYAKALGESDVDYNNRMLREVEAFITAPKIAEKLENLRNENPSLWQQIIDFITNLKAWLKTQIGLSDYQGDILSMTKEEYIDALGVSVLKDDYKPLYNLQVPAIEIKPINEKRKLIGPRNFDKVLSRAKGFIPYGTEIRDMGNESGTIPYRDIFPTPTIEDFYMATTTIFDNTEYETKTYSEKEGIWEKLKDNDYMIHQNSPSSNSEYLIDSRNGNIYRYADHWGTVASCRWYLKKPQEFNRLQIGISNIKDFQANENGWGFRFPNPKLLQEGANELVQSLSDLTSIESDYLLTESQKNIVEKYNTLYQEKLGKLISFSKKLQNRDSYTMFQDSPIQPSLQKMQNDIMLQQMALDSRLEILILPSEQEEEDLLDKIDNCGL